MRITTAWPSNSVRDNSVLAVVHHILTNNLIRSATVYQSKELTVTATRRGKPDGRSGHCEMVLTIGKPNFRGRQFVKACLEAGEAFPVRKVQLRWMKARKGKA